MPHGRLKQFGFGKDMSIESVEEHTVAKHVMADLTGSPKKDWHYIGSGGE